MKKIVLLLALSLSISLFSETFASVNGVQNLTISEADNWFLLKWNRVYDSSWNQIQYYEILMSDYSVWDFDYYEKSKKITYLPDWAIIDKFWKSDFEKNKTYFFSVIAIDSSWEKSETYSNEVSMNFTWENIEAIIANDSFSTIKTTNSTKEVELNSWSVVLKNAGSEVVVKTNLNIETGSNIELAKNLVEPEVELFDWSDDIDTTNLKAAAEKDIIAPENVTNLEAWYKRFNWNNYKVDVDWTASIDSKWDLDYHNFYDKASKDTEWWKEQLKKEETHIQKIMAWGDEYSFKVTTIDKNKNESTWILASIDIPMYLPTTWAPVLAMILASIFSTLLYKIRRKEESAE